MGLVILATIVGQTDEADAGRGDPFPTSFTVSPTDPVVGEEVTFVSDLGAGRAGVIRWQFSFCPPGQACALVYTGYGQEVVYVFNQAGDWQVDLQVGITKERVGTASARVAVMADVAPTFKADFQVLRLSAVDPNTGAETWVPVGLSEDDPIAYGERVKLDSSPSVGAAYFRWREDGKLISTKPSEIRTYTGPKTIQVSLQVYNAAATESETATKSLIVDAGIDVLSVLSTSLGDARGIAIDGNTAWVSRLSQELVGVDVTYPNQLNRLVTFPARFGWNVAAANGRVFVATPSTGLDIHVNPLNSQNRTVWNYDTRSQDGQIAYDVKAIDNVVFLAGGPAGLKVIDVSNPASLRTVSVVHLPSGGQSMRLAIGDDRLFVADHANKVYWIDIARLDTQRPVPVSLAPSAPAQVGGAVEQLMVSDRGVLACFTFGAVDLFEVAGPTGLRFASRVDLVALGGRAAGSVGLFGSDLYVAYANGGVWPFEIFVLNAVNPRSPYVMQTGHSSSEIAGVIKGAAAHGDAVLWCSGSHDLFSSSTVR